MALTQKQKRNFRQLVHSRKPVVTVGQHGLTPSVLAEIDRALTDHELLKIKLPATNRTIRQELVQTISRQTGAEVVQTVGRILTVYRQGAETGK